MTRFEISSAVQSALRQIDPSLLLVSIRALPFSWELRFEDRDGAERVVTIHHGSTASVTSAISHALQFCS
jgi:hypothetical protein